MNYKEVLENQIKKLEEVQEQVLKGIIEREENAAYTERTLSVIASTALKIQSLVTTINELESKQTVTSGNSNGPNLITIGSKIENTQEFQEHVQRSLEKMLLHYRKK